MAIRTDELVLERVVVLGGGVAGLVTARVVHDVAAEVTVVERDLVPADVRSRSGVPQGRHVHALLSRGRRALESLFPGITDELVRRGAAVGDVLADTRVHVGVGELARTTCGQTLLSATRPLVEDELRRRVAALPRVQMTPAADAAGLVVAEEGTAVTGVRLVGRAAGSPSEVVEASLVVDATGRGARAAAWFRAAGLVAPPVERVGVPVAYASALVDAGRDDLDRAIACLVLPTPERPRGGSVARVEGGRWLCSLVGVDGVDPPLDPGGFASFAASLGVPDVARIATRPLLQPAVRHRVPDSRRRRYDRLRRPPTGFVAVGDAHCALNPVYGQGITAAILQARALGDHLTAGLEPGGRRLLRTVARAVDIPWAMSRGADSRFPGAQGATAGDRVLARWVDRVHGAATLDAELAARWMEISGLVRPPTALFSPVVAARVVKSHAGMTGRHSRRDRRRTSRTELT